MRGISLALAIIATSLVAGTAFAQAPPADDEDDGVVCLAIAHLWRGTTQDVRQISRVPVPDSYRRMFEAGGCGRFSLVEETLIDWHLAFGDEASVTAAMAYLEADYTKGGPGTAVLPRALADARRAALRDLRAAESGLAVSGADYERADRALGRSARIRLVRELTGARDNYLFLARQYLRAAEFYGSRALLAKARLYDSAVRESIALVGAPDPALSHAEGRLRLWPENMNSLNDLEMRLAIGQARLTRDPADIEAATQVLERHYSPVLRLTANNAYEHGGDFCGTGDGDHLAPMREACLHENNFEWRVVSYWRNRAHLDLVAVAPGVRTEPSSYHIAINLLEHGRLRAALEGAPRFGGADEDILALRLARAELYLRQAESLRAEGGREGENEAQGQESGALNELGRAERIVSPAVAPQWFRRIALPYLALADRIRARETADPEIRPGASRVDMRAVAHFRAVLDDLDHIAIGDLPPG